MNMTNLSCTVEHWIWSIRQVDYELQLHVYSTFRNFLKI